MKIKRLILSLLVIFFALSLNAQGFENPVTWSSKAVLVKDNVYEVQLSGSMSGKWHIYDLGPYTDGPIPTTLTISGGDGVKLQGKPYIKTKVHKYFDNMFNMEIGTCGSGVVIAQKVVVSSAKETTININVEWQTCDDGSCLPPTDEDLKVKLPAAVGGTEAAVVTPALTKDKNDNSVATEGTPATEVVSSVSDTLVQDSEQEHKQNFLMEIKMLAQLL